MPGHDVEGGRFIIRGRVDSVESQNEALARARLAGLRDAAPAGMVLVDRDGNIVLANAMAEAQFGYVRDELIGMSAELLLPERFRGRYHKLRASLLRDPSVRPMGAIQDLFGLRKDR